MHGKVILDTVDDWMSRHAPPVPQERNAQFTDILKRIPVDKGKETAMYGPLANAVNNCQLCPGFTLVATPSRSDPSDESREAIDTGLYPTGREPLPVKDDEGKVVLSAATSWAEIDLCIECKADSGLSDPFDETAENGEPTTDGQKKVLGQVYSYVELVLKHQQRTHVYMVLLLGDDCRLALFDRSGAMVSKKFNYKDHSDPLIEFLWRYTRWTAEQRGHDPSAERIPHQSSLGTMMVRRSHTGKNVENPGDYVRKQFHESLRSDWPWWKLRVDDETGPRYFLVGKPHFQAKGVAGRGTRGYVALAADDPSGPFYYIKDAWRVMNPGIDKEGTILEELNRQHVPYVPTLVYHGDVFRSVGQAEKRRKEKSWAEGADDDSSMQVTKAQDVWQDKHKDDKDARCPFKKHKHYRIVVREVAKSLTEFTNSRQLIQAVLCCVFAHSRAYKAGVIHRDISAGNMLLYFDPKKRKWHGLLNDWELSKQTNSDHPAGRQLDRTGTWQFMSAQALQTPSKEIVVQDELESFVHVVLFLAIRFLPHNCPKVADFMHEYFDGYTTYNGGPTCGAFKMLCMVGGRIPIVYNGDYNAAIQVQTKLKFLWPTAKPEQAAPTDSQEQRADSQQSADSEEKLVLQGTNSEMQPSSAQPRPEAPKPHPLNAVLGTALKWLKAYYAVTIPRESEEPVPMTTEADTDPTRDDDFECPEIDISEDEEANDSDVADASGKERDELLARKLSSHAAFLKLLRDSLRDVARWPLEDKVPDQLPKDGHDPDGDLLTAHMRKGGSVQHYELMTGDSSTKRRSEQMDGWEKQGPPKRAKSQVHD